MSDKVQVVLIALGWAGAVAVLGALSLRALRYRPQRQSLLALCLTTVGAVIAATIGTAHAMFLSHHDYGVLLIVSGVVAVLMAGVSGLYARMLTASSRAVVEAMASRAAKGAPPGPDLTITKS